MRAVIAVIALVWAGLVGVLAAAPASADASSAGLFVPLSPARILDTRNGTGATAPGAFGTITVQIDGHGGIPSNGVTAVVVNVTVTGATAGGYVTVYADGIARPHASNLNFVRGQTVPNLVTVPVGSDGKIDLFNGSRGSVQLIGDVSGYYSATANGTAGAYIPTTPTRLLDTRYNVGGAAPGPKGTVNLAVGGTHGIPGSGVSAAVVNVTVTRPTSNGYVTVYETGRTRPAASNLNFVAGQTVPNLVTVPLGSGGKVSLYNGSTGTTQLIADVEGYYLSGAPTQPGAFTPTTPYRLLDTRQSVGGSRPGPGGTVKLLVDGSGAVPPTGISAIVMNVTVTAPTAGGYITVYADNRPRPTASNLNFHTGQTVPNLVVAPVGTDGKLDLYNGSAGSTHLIGDVAGYFWSVANPWVPMTHALPGAADTGGLDAISCTAATSCIAVGQYLARSTDTINPLIETLSGEGWAPTYPPLVTGTNEEFLTGVACSSSTACLAVGYAQASDGSSSLVALTLAGGTWTTDTNVPLPANAQLDSGKQLLGVSCTSTGACTAVGFYYDTSGDPQAFAATRADGAWSAGEVAVPAGATDGTLDGISCTSASDCVAVGSFVDSIGTFHPWIERRTGSTWTRASIQPPPGGGYVGPLNGVSCTSATDCVAVGDAGEIVTLANGAWTTQRFVLPASGYSFDFRAVSCSSATDCTAVGAYDINRAGDQQALVATLNSGSWSLLGLPELAGEPAQLNSVSCSSPTGCSAAGVTRQPSFSELPLTESRS